MIVHLEIMEFKKEIFFKSKTKKKRIETVQNFKNNIVGNNTSSYITYCHLKSSCSGYKIYA